MIHSFHPIPDDTTFALGYSNGTGLYLPSSRMIAEGGYEVDSYFEYGFSAPLAAGMEKIITREISTFQSKMLL